MRNSNVLRQKQRLDSLFKKAEFLLEDLELHAQWAQHLCVLVAGFLESSVRTLYTEYAYRCATPGVANFVAASLARTTNLNMEKIVQLARSFDENWGEVLGNKSEGHTKNAIDSIYNNRNLVAHGRDCGITMARIKDYYSEAVKLIEAIEQQCTCNR